jgi:thiamine transport system substrate-binding protein
MFMTQWRTLGMALAVVLATLAAAGCGGSEDTPSEVVLITHDSFAISKQVKAAFEQETGLRLRILQGGDAGEALNRALLTKSDPQGDVFFGVDNNLLSRALDEGLFEPYSSPGLDDVPSRYVLDSEHRVTPVDHGDVCLNVDRSWFRSRGIKPPKTLDDLTHSRYRKLLVVENPATSTPGLAFLLATVAHFGENGWKSYWTRLRENGVLVVDGWEEAYTAQFSGAAGSKGRRRPIVVSYATSPAAEVIFAGKPLAQPPTAVVQDSCFRQVELAGILSGARNEQGAEKLIDFMLDKRFQEDVPKTMFVLPVRNGTTLPDAFAKHAVVPDAPLDLPPATIGANRDGWIDEWTRIVLR